MRAAGAILLQEEGKEMLRGGEQRVMSLERERSRCESQKLVSAGRMTEITMNGSHEEHADCIFIFQHTFLLAWHSCLFALLTSNKKNNIIELNS